MQNKDQTDLGLYINLYCKTKSTSVVSDFIITDDICYLVSLKLQFKLGLKLGSKLSFKLKLILALV